MNTATVDVLAREGNVAILQLPERRFPAIPIQGDSFSILAALARSVAAHAAQVDDVELGEEAAELRDSLDAILRAYEVALHAHGIPLPYVKPSPTRGP
jgi:hypothetical protein